MRHGRRKNGRSAQAAALGLQPHRRGGGGRYVKGGFVDKEGKFHEYGGGRQRPRERGGRREQSKRQRQAAQHDEERQRNQECRDVCTRVLTCSSASVLHV